MVWLVIWSIFLLVPPHTADLISDIYCSCRKLGIFYLDAVLCVFAKPILTLGSKQFRLPIELLWPESMSSRWKIPSLPLAMNRNIKKAKTQNRPTINTFSNFLVPRNIFEADDFQLKIPLVLCCRVDCTRWQNPRLCRVYRYGGKARLNWKKLVWVLAWKITWVFAWDSPH